MALLRIGELPEEALAASAHFHADRLPRIESELREGGNRVLVFAPADHTHRGWRLAAVQQLARRHAPGRVNALESADEAAIAAALAYLEAAPGVTGQLLPLDGTGSGEILSPQE